MVANGTIDLVVEAGLKSWDIEAAIPVLEGAGGLVTDWRGGPIGHPGGEGAIRRGRPLLREALGAPRRAAEKARAAPPAPPTPAITPPRADRSSAGSRG